jgi:ABC-type spermidine/putrescine transport system permease subunit II
MRILATEAVPGMGHGVALLLLFPPLGGRLSFVTIVLGFWNAAQVEVIH